MLYINSYISTFEIIALNRPKVKRVFDFLYIFLYIGTAEFRCRSRKNVLVGV